MWMAACALALMSPAAAQDLGLRATGGCAVVPILPGPIPVVEVTIGGKGPYRFAIDTGAQGHGRISTALAEELGLPKVGEVGTPAPGGTVATRPVFGAPEVSVGGVSFKNVDLVALSDVRGPEIEWDGILGNELLTLLPLTLDYGAARARFGGPELTEGLPIAFDRGIPVLPLTIAGKRFKVHFDSGNGAGALFLDEAAARALPLAGEPVERGSARTSFGDFAVMEAPLAASVTAGTTPLTVQAVGWPSPRPGGNLGSRGMAGLSVTIDAKAELARIERSGRAPRCPG
jgi:predicted aspartyl protease